MVADISDAVNTGSDLSEALEHALKQENSTPGFFIPTILLIEKAQRQLELDKQAYLDHVSSESNNED